MPPECHDLSFLCFLISLNIFFSSFPFWLACSQPILWVIILWWDSPSSILLSKLKTKWFLSYLLVLNGDQKAGLGPRTWFKVLASEKPFSFLAVLWWVVDSDKWPTDEEGQALLAVGNQDTWHSRCFGFQYWMTHWTSLLYCNLWHRYLSWIWITNLSISTRVLYKPLWNISWEVLDHITCGWEESFIQPRSPLILTRVSMCATRV